MFVPAISLISPAAIALVGDPTSVPSPPIDAAKAMPIISAPAMPLVSPSRMAPARNTAAAIGTMISVVDVFDMNIDSKAVETMKANSNPRAPLLARANMASARRPCSPLRSIASARNAPPRISRMIES